MRSPQLWTDGAVSSGIGIAVTAHASANTKGSSYTQLLASTSHAASWLLISPKTDVGTAADFLVDIAVGGAASEVNIISNLMIPGRLVGGSSPILIPVNIPAGTRISARCQATTGGLSVYLDLAYGAGEVFAEHAVTYGADTSDSGGTGIDPGGSAGSKGNYAQLTASTTAPIKWLIICVGARNNSTMSDFGWLIDIAIGPATETVVIPNLQVWSGSTPDIISPHIFCVPIEIPTGTRLTARAQCNGTDATDRLLDVTVIGVG